MGRLPKKILIAAKIDKEIRNANVSLNTNRPLFAKPPQYPKALWESILVEFFFYNECKKLTLLLGVKRKAKVKIKVLGKAKAKIKAKVKAKVKDNDDEIIANFERLLFIPHSLRKIKNKKIIQNLIEKYHPLGFVISLYQTIYNDNFTKYIQRNGIKAKHYRLLKRAIYLNCLTKYLQTFTPTPMKYQSSVDAEIAIIIYTYSITNDISFMPRLKTNKILNIIEEARSDQLSQTQLFVKHFEDIISFDFYKIEIDTYRKKLPLKYEYQNYPALQILKKRIRNRKDSISNKQPYQSLCDKIVQNILNNQ